jgi:rhomboid protease GluP
MGNPTSDQLLYWGADNAGNVLLQGQWWRIVTAMFVHVGILHLATNMWCLWNLGLLAEPLMGSTGVLAVYILTGAAGNLLSTCVNWFWFNQDWVKFHDMGVFPAGAGASGAVFGIAGALIILLKSPSAAGAAAGTAQAAQVGDLLCRHQPGAGPLDQLWHHGGALRPQHRQHGPPGRLQLRLALRGPMVPRIGSPRDLFLFRLRIAMVMVVGILVLFGFYLAQLPR